MEENLQPQSEQSSDTRNPQIPNQSDPHVPEHHKHAKIVLIFSFFVLLVVIIAGSYYLIQQNDSQNIMQAPNSNTAQETVIEKKAEEVNEAPQGYLSYKNDDLNVEFVYPEEWGNYVEGAPSEFDTKSIIVIKFFNDDIAPMITINDAATYYYSIRYSGVDVYYDIASESWTSRPTVGVSYVDDSQEFPETKVIGDFTIAVFGFGDAGFSSLNNAFVFGDKIIVLEESREPEDQDNKFDIFNQQVELFGLGNSKE